MSETDEADIVGAKWPARWAVSVAAAVVVDCLAFLTLAAAQMLFGMLQAEKGVTSLGWHVPLPLSIAAVAAQVAAYKESRRSDRFWVLLIVVSVFAVLTVLVFRWSLAVDQASLR